MRFCFYTLFFTVSIMSNAQQFIAVEKPQINSGNFVITDTVFISPKGNDANNGSEVSPVRTFNRAVSLLPYGTAGVNGGNAYGLIVVDSGDYIISTGWSVSPSVFQKGNTFKNVSIEGKGRVTIGGTPSKPCQGHGLVVTGSHLFIKNLNIKHCTGTGVLVIAPDGVTNRISDIGISQINTDSVGGFGMLIKKVDRLSVVDCSVLRSSQVYAGIEASPCQWPSGLKFFGCSNITTQQCTVAYTRGEGLNFHNSLNGYAWANNLHDNTTNIYDDNSKNLELCRNYIYNTSLGESLYWRGCPADTVAKRTPQGILIANEGACTEDNSSGVTFENCRTRCAIPLHTIPNADSVFIYNNVFQNSGSVINLWEGSTQIFGTNCISNVYFFNNTCIGVMGNIGNGDAVIKAFFPTYNPLVNSYSSLSNIHIYNNIFTADLGKYPLYKSFISTFNTLHPTKNAIKLQNNLWSFTAAPRGSNDSTHANLPGSLPLFTGNYNPVIPCINNPEFYMPSVKAGPGVPADFEDTMRAGNDNVGAFAYRQNCITTGAVLRAKNEFVIYPNPAVSYFYLSGIVNPVQVLLTDMAGRSITVHNQTQGKYLLPEGLEAGMYVVCVKTTRGNYNVRLLVER